MKLTVVPIIVGKLGTIPKNFESGLEGLEIGGQTDTI